MFNNQRYVTKGVQEGIPLELQAFCWKLIDELKETQTSLDYLQVFEFYPQEINGVQQQQIKHRQEIPPYEQAYTLNQPIIIKVKLYAIDDVSHSTLLLGEEY